MLVQHQTVMRRELDTQTMVGIVVIAIILVLTALAIAYYLCQRPRMHQRSSKPRRSPRRPFDWRVLSRGPDMGFCVDSRLGQQAFNNAPLYPDNRPRVYQVFNTDSANPVVVEQVHCR
ncbi:hypothetical protein CDD81_8139 [Ophiocordyceps australis]|uniref:Uncharacterized protein n=1 Tax=Ophiocordyceps australis TaxID=1399860 RepID=A0A2C5Y3U2_9HYPO|nr:hypothetical protein CDD81_8139 [Ophiocordyceps australis]